MQRLARLFNRGKKEEQEAIATPFSTTSRKKSFNKEIKRAGSAL
jgi:hypothetical protein